MERLTITENTFLWGDTYLEKVSYEIVDSEMIHIVFTDRTIGFKILETEINGVVIQTINEMIEKITQYG